MKTLNLVLMAIIIGCDQLEAQIQSSATKQPSKPINEVEISKPTNKDSNFESSYMGRYVVDNSMIDGYYIPFKSAFAKKNRFFLEWRNAMKQNKMMPSVSENEISQTSIFPKKYERFQYSKKKLNKLGIRIKTNKHNVKDEFNETIKTVKLSKASSKSQKLIDKNETLGLNLKHVSSQLKPQPKISMREFIKRIKFKISLEYSPPKLNNSSTEVEKLNIFDSSMSSHGLLKKPKLAIKKSIHGMATKIRNIFLNLISTEVQKLNDKIDFLKFHISGPNSSEPLKQPKLTLKEFIKEIKFKNSSKVTSNLDSAEVQKLNDKIDFLKFHIFDFNSSEPLKEPKLSLEEFIHQMKSNNGLISSLNSSKVPVEVQKLNDKIDFLKFHIFGSNSSEPLKEPKLTLKEFIEEMKLENSSKDISNFNSSIKVPAKVKKLNEKIDFLKFHIFGSNSSEPMKEPKLSLREFMHETELELKSRRKSNINNFEITLKNISQEVQKLTKRIDFLKLHFVGLPESPIDYFTQQDIDISQKEISPSSPNHPANRISNELRLPREPYAFVFNVRNIVFSRYRVPFIFKHLIKIPDFLKIPKYQEKVNRSLPKLTLPFEKYEKFIQFVEMHDKLLPQAITLFFGELPPMPSRPPMWFWVPPSSELRQLEKRDANLTKIIVLPFIFKTNEFRIYNEKNETIYKLDNSYWDQVKATLSIKYSPNNTAKQLEPFLPGFYRSLKFTDDPDDLLPLPLKWVKVFYAAWYGPKRYRTIAYRPKFEEYNAETNLHYLLKYFNQMRQEVFKQHLEMGGHGLPKPELTFVFFIDPTDDEERPFDNSIYFYWGLELLTPRYHKLYQFNDTYEEVLIGEDETSVPTSEKRISSIKQDVNELGKELITSKGAKVYQHNKDNLQKAPIRTKRSEQIIPFGAPGLPPQILLAQAFVSANRGKKIEELPTKFVFPHITNGTPRNDGDGLTKPEVVPKFSKTHTFNVQPSSYNTGNYLKNVYSFRKSEYISDPLLPMFSNIEEDKPLIQRIIENVKQGRDTFIPRNSQFPRPRFPEKYIYERKNPLPKGVKKITINYGVPVYLNKIKSHEVYGPPQHRSKRSAIFETVFDSNKKSFPRRFYEASRKNYGNSDLDNGSKSKIRKSLESRSNIPTKIDSKCIVYGFPELFVKNKKEMTLPVDKSKKISKITINYEVPVYLKPYKSGFTELLVKPKKEMTLPVDKSKKISKITINYGVPVYLKPYKSGFRELFVKPKKEMTVDKSKKISKITINYGVPVYLKPYKSKSSNPQLFNLPLTTKSRPFVVSDLEEKRITNLPVTTKPKPFLVSDVEVVTLKAPLQNSSKVEKTKDIGDIGQTVSYSYYLGPNPANITVSHEYFSQKQTGKPQKVYGVSRIKRSTISSPIFNSVFVHSGNKPLKQKFSKKVGVESFPVQKKAYDFPTKKNSNGKSIIQKELPINQKNIQLSTLTSKQVLQKSDVTVKPISTLTSKQVLQKSDVTVKPINTLTSKQVLQKSGVTEKPISTLTSKQILQKSDVTVKPISTLTSKQVLQKSDVTEKPISTLTSKQVLQKSDVTEKPISTLTSKQVLQKSDVTVKPISTLTSKQVLQKSGVTVKPILAIEPMQSKPIKGHSNLSLPKTFYIQPFNNIYTNDVQFNRMFISPTLRNLKISDDRKIKVSPAKKKIKIPIKDDARFNLYPPFPGDPKTFNHFNTKGYGYLYRYSLPSSFTRYLNIPDNRTEAPQKQVFEPTLVSNYFFMNNITVFQRLHNFLLPEMERSAPFSNSTARSKRSINSIFASVFNSDGSKSLQRRFYEGSHRNMQYPQYKSNCKHRNQVGKARLQQYVVDLNRNYAINNQIPSRNGMLLPRIRFTKQFYNKFERNFNKLPSATKTRPFGKPPTVSLVNKSKLFLPNSADNIKNNLNPLRTVKLQVPSFKSVSFGSHVAPNYAANAQIPSRNGMILSKIKVGTLTLPLFKKNEKLSSEQSFNQLPIATKTRPFGKSPTGSIVNKSKLSLPNSSDNIKNNFSRANPLRTLKLQVPSFKGASFAPIASRNGMVLARLQLATLTLPLLKKNDKLIASDQKFYQLPITTKTRPFGEPLADPIVYKSKLFSPNSPDIVENSFLHLNPLGNVILQDPSIKSVSFGSHVAPNHAKSNIVVRDSPNIIKNNFSRLQLNPLGTVIMQLPSFQSVSFLRYVAPNHAKSNLFLPNSPHIIKNNVSHLNLLGTVILDLPSFKSASFRSSFAPDSAVNAEIPSKNKKKLKKVVTHKSKLFLPNSPGIINSHTRAPELQVSNTNEKNILLVNNNVAKQLSVSDTKSLRNRPTSNPNITEPDFVSIIKPVESYPKLPQALVDNINYNAQLVSSKINKTSLSSSPTNVWNQTDLSKTIRKNANSNAFEKNVKHNAQFSIGNDFNKDIGLPNGSKNHTMGAKLPNFSKEEATKKSKASDSTNNSFVAPKVPLNQSVDYLLETLKYLPHLPKVALTKSFGSTLESVKNTSRSANLPTILKNDSFLPNLHTTKGLKNNPDAVVSEPNTSKKNSIIVEILPDLPKVVSTKDFIQNLQLIKHNSVTTTLPVKVKLSNQPKVTKTLEENIKYNSQFISGKKEESSEIKSRYKTTQSDKNFNQNNTTTNFEEHKMNIGLSQHSALKVPNTDTLIKHFNPEDITKVSTNLPKTLENNAKKVTKFNTNPQISAVPIKNGLKIPKTDLEVTHFNPESITKLSTHLPEFNRANKYNSHLISTKTKNHNLLSQNSLKLLKADKNTTSFPTVYKPIGNKSPKTALSTHNFNTKKITNSPTILPKAIQENIKYNSQFILTKTDITKSTDTENSLKTAKTEAEILRFNPKNTTNTSKNLSTVYTPIENVLKMSKTGSKSQHFTSTKLPTNQPKALEGNIKYNSQFIPTKTDNPEIQSLKIPKTDSKILNFKSEHSQFLVETPKINETISQKNNTNAVQFQIPKIPKGYMFKENAMLWPKVNIIRQNKTFVPVLDNTLKQNIAYNAQFAKPPNASHKNPEVTIITQENVTKIPQITNNISNKINEPTTVVEEYETPKENFNKPKFFESTMQNVTNQAIRHHRKRKRPVNIVAQWLKNNETLESSKVNNNKNVNRADIPIEEETSENSQIKNPLYVANRANYPLANKQTIKTNNRKVVIRKNLSNLYNVNSARSRFIVKNRTLKNNTEDALANENLPKKNVADNVVSENGKRKVLVRVVKRPSRKNIVASMLNQENPE